MSNLLGNPSIPLHPTNPTTPPPHRPLASDIYETCKDDPMLDRYSGEVEQMVLWKYFDVMDPIICSKVSGVLELSGGRVVGWQWLHPASVTTYRPFPRSTPTTARLRRKQVLASTRGRHR